MKFNIETFSNTPQKIVIKLIIIYHHATLNSFFPSSSTSSSHVLRSTCFSTKEIIWYDHVNESHQAILSDQFDFFWTVMVILEDSSIFQLDSDSGGD